MQNKFVCIHGHFYQPPRENPWTDAVETEASAAPHHDWNERILQECYKPNTESRLLDGNGGVRKRLNNYEHISFNFGPTLMHWMERQHPEIGRRIVEADRRSLAYHAGHGNAIAQVYNHVIMPLASRRDKETQVRWGVADFRARFRRDPEGMWLAETAVDAETLEVLISEGVRFTILAPKQAAKVRPIAPSPAPLPKGERENSHSLARNAGDLAKGSTTSRMVPGADIDGREGGGEGWMQVTEQTLDVMRPYRWFSRESPGRFIDLCFYHGPIAHAISFERLLNSGDAFADRILSAFSADDSVQLVSIATDGENYGHHHPFGNMALSYALEKLSQQPGVRITNYGEFLSRYPPTQEAEIHPATAWSCAHGVGRWKEDCGCSTGAHPDWNQKWRRPLREALDWLASEIDSFYVQRFQIARPFQDPWAARNACIQDVLLQGSESFLSRLFLRRLFPSQTKETQRLLDMERQRLLMFTSCGWFFDDISGIEPVQILKYAARAVDLAVELGHPRGDSLETELLERLARCPSNEPQHQNGAEVFRRFVVPLRPDLKRTVAHSRTQ